MPEGAECRLHAEFLARELTGIKVTQIEYLSGRYVKNPPDSHPHGFGKFKTLLPINSVGAGCHGKFIYILFEGGVSMWSTLGMSGAWTANPKMKHLRVAIHRADRSPLYLSDTRNFGTLRFSTSPNELKEKLSSLGPDVLQGVSDRDFVESVRRKNSWSICKAIMDQSVVAGIGNYVKAESLWRAKINPEALVEELSDWHLINLKNSAENVLRESYNHQGASIRNYRNPDGKEGNFVFQMRVYGKRNDAEGNEVVKEQTSDGRTTHWAPARQIIPNEEE